jgi:hypothetical protein
MATQDAPREPSIARVRTAMREHDQDNPQVGPDRNRVPPHETLDADGPDGDEASSVPERP